MIGEIKPAARTSLIDRIGSSDRITPDASGRQMSTREV